MKVIRQSGWVYYVEDDSELDDSKVGKWMYFFNNRKFVEKICAEAIERGVVVESKHTDDKEGVACFYLNCDDLEGHKKVITYFLENELIRKTKAGNLYNISFKRDEQTSMYEYGSGFKSEIKLADLIDLSTGIWRITEEEFELLMPPEVQQRRRHMKALNKAKSLETTNSEDITYAQCEEAVKTWYLALKYVPEPYRTEEICRSAMNHGVLSEHVVEFIPSKILTTAFVNDVIRENTFLIGRFPAELLTSETVIELAINDSTLLKTIPTALKNLSFYKSIVQNNGMYLRFVPRDLISQEICNLAVQSRPAAIKYVPEYFIDTTLCELAVSIDWKAIRSIPKHYLTDKLFEIALSSHPKSKKTILKEKENTLK